MEPVNKGSIQVIRSMPDFNFPAFEEQKQKGGPPKPPTVKRSGVTIDLGTPNLGTVWEISSLSIFYEQLRYFYFNATGLTLPLEFYAVFVVYMGSQEIFREVSNKVTLSGETLRPEGIGPTTQTTLVGLQNLAQILRIPGGQQITLELFIVETPETSAIWNISGSLTRGKITMNYNLMDYHKPPRRYRA